MQCGEDVGWEMGFQSLQKINTLLENQETRCLTFSLMFSKEWSLCADRTCSTPERRPCTIHGEFVQQCCHFRILGTGLCGPTFTCKIRKGDVQFIVNSRQSSGMTSGAFHYPMKHYSHTIPPCHFKRLLY